MTIDAALLAITKMLKQSEQPVELTVHVFDDIKHVLPSLSYRFLNGELRRFVFPQSRVVFLRGIGYS
jgi:hypothetical protein